MAMSQYAMFSRIWQVCPAASYADAAAWATERGVPAVTTGLDAHPATNHANAAKYVLMGFLFLALGVMQGA